MPWDFPKVVRAKVNKAKEFGNYLEAINTVIDVRQKLDKHAISLLQVPKDLESNDPVNIGWDSISFNDEYAWIRKLAIIFGHYFDLQTVHCRYRDDEQDLTQVQTIGRESSRAAYKETIEFMCGEIWKRAEVDTENKVYNCVRNGAYVIARQTYEELKKRYLKRYADEPTLDYIAKQSRLAIRGKKRVIAYLDAYFPDRCPEKLNPLLFTHEIYPKRFEPVMVNVDNLDWFATAPNSKKQLLL